MTNTDTVDAIGTAIQVKELAHRRLGDGAHHRQHARSGGRGAAHPRAARPHGHRRAAGRRLPLQRPPPADRLPGLRRGARRSTASTRATSARATSATASSRRWSRRPCRYDKPVRIGVNWGSLDQELLAAADGRERAACAEPLRAAADHVPRASSRRRSSRRAAPRRSACAREQIILSCKMSGVQDLISVYRALARALRLRAAPRPHRSRHGHQGHGRLDRGAGACCCRKASATRSASR